MPAREATATDLITQDEQLLIGASWYPETWPEAEWPKDIARMRELGFNLVRVFEFAWHRLEPSEGRYDFDWAVKILDLCHGAGIRVVIGTPTAAPPAWLTSTYPETLQVGADGTPRKHGKRKHGSHISSKYRELSRKIVSKMAEQFADHPAVHAWQIDNEMGGRDFSDEARAKFHACLEARFGTVEAMNEAWGLEFWSQAYSSFDQVPMPTAAVGSIEVPERHHPSLIMAIAEFNSAAWEQFIQEQVDILRAASDKPITTNMCSVALSMDWFAINRRLDRVGYSLYKDLPHYHWNLLSADRMRGESWRSPGVRRDAPPAEAGSADEVIYRPWWTLETAPNWSGGGRIWNIHEHAEGLRCITWLSAVTGGSAVLYWQWRGHRAGQEMNHGTCVDATGKWRPNKAMWQQVAREYDEHGQWLLANPPRRGDVGLFMSPRAAWGWSIDPLDAGVKYADDLRDLYHLPLCRAHVWRDLIDEGGRWEDYRVLAIPQVPTLSGDVKARLRAWVEAGGRLLLGPMSGFRTEEFTAFTDRSLGGLEELIGAEQVFGFPAHARQDHLKVRFSDAALGEGATAATTATQRWCDAFEPTTGRAIATYAGDGEYADGLAAAVEHTVGDGRVITLGCMVDPAVYVALTKRLLADVGLSPVAEGDGDVVVVPRGDAGMALINLVPEPRKVTLPQAGVDRLTGEPAGPTVELGPLRPMLVAWTRD